jgi:hypothetical protein
MLFQLAFIARSRAALCPAKHGFRRQIRPMLEISIGHVLAIVHFRNLLAARQRMKLASK